MTNTTRRRTRPSAPEAAGDARAKLVKFQHVAVFNQYHIIVRVARDVIFDIFLVPEQHSVFTVNWHNELGPYGFSHNANVFLGRMSAHMDQAALFFNYIRAPLVDEADHP